MIYEPIIKAHQKNLLSLSVCQNVLIVKLLKNLLIIQNFCSINLMPFHRILNF